MLRGSNWGEAGYRQTGEGEGGQEAGKGETGTGVALLVPADSKPFFSKCPAVLASGALGKMGPQILIAGRK